MCAPVVLVSGRRAHRGGAGEGQGEERWGREGKGGERRGEGRGGEERRGEGGGEKIGKRRRGQMVGKGRKGMEGQGRGMCN